MDFDAVVAAKEKQCNALTKEVVDKTARVGDGGVKLPEMNRRHAGWRQEGVSGYVGATCLLSNKCVC